MDDVKGQPPLRLYQSRFELQREAQARGREKCIRWYCDRLRPILDTQMSEFVREDLNALQQMLGLSNEDILPIQLLAECDSLLDSYASRARQDDLTQQATKSKLKVKQVD